MSKKTTVFTKIALFVLALAMLVTACGQAPATTAPSETQPAEAPTKAAEVPTEAPAELVDIEFWINPSVSEAGPPPDDWIAYEIIREKLGINFKLTILPSITPDQNVKLNAAAAANALPDFFQVSRDTLYKFVEQGLVAPVDELYPLMPERTKSHYNDPDMNQLAIFDGVSYGLAESGLLLGTNGVVVRKDWLDKLGLEAPKTVDEFLEVAKAFTEQDPDGNGKNDTYGYGTFIDGGTLLYSGLGMRNDWIYGAYGVAGMWNVESPDTFGLNVRNPDYFRATQFFKELVDAKVIDPDWPTLTKDEFRARWKQGRYGMMQEHFCALACGFNYGDFDKNFPDGEWIAIPPLAGPDGKSSTGVIIKTPNLFAVSKTAMDAGKGPAIAKLLEWMNTDEGYFLLGFGQEGINFKLDEDGNVSTEGIDPKLAWDSKEMQPYTQLRNQLIFIWKPLELHACCGPFTTQNGRPMDPMAIYDFMKKQPWTNETAAAVIDPPSNTADFSRYYGENIIQFVLGQKPLNEETWAEFLAGLDSLGAKEWEASAKESVQTAGFWK
jgi:putative aldouronate transport system substrate-binding protein